LQGNHLRQVPFFEVRHPPAEQDAGIKLLAVIHTLEESTLRTFGGGILDYVIHAIAKRGHDH